METRPRKPNDQEQIEIAFNLMKDCMASHPEIEPTLWAGAIWSVLVEGYAQSGVSYEQFSKEWNSIKHHYKSWFDCNQME